MDLSTVRELKGDIDPEAVLFMADKLERAEREVKRLTQVAEESSRRIQVVLDWMERIVK